MINPLVGSLVQQSVPASNTVQPGISDTSKKPEDNKQVDSTRTQGADAARAERTDNRDQRPYQAAQADNRATDTGGVYSSASRGTHIDITA